MTDRVWWVVAVSWLACPTAFSATLSVGNLTANPGQTVTAPVVLGSGGAAIAGIQFDLQWDPGISIDVAPGGTLGESDKALYIAVRGARALRCLMVGMNVTSIPDGPLVNLFISAAGNAPSQSANVNLSNVIAADGLGEAVALQTTSGSVQIESGLSQVFPAGAILNGASLLTGVVAPGEIITLLGGFPGSPALLFNGTPAPVIYASSNQINAIVPFELDVSGPATVQITSQNQTVAQQSLPVAAVAPAIFTLASTGIGAAAVLNQDYTVNTFLNPATANSVLMVYGTGFGPMQSSVTDGQIVNSATPLMLPVTATIGGLPAVVSYAGSAPGLIAGLTQVNVQVPPGLPANPAAPLFLTVGSVTTPPGVTVSIR
ncbi:MAG TPA: cohesin domain-containing protein [Bryobacteraceae bacterium]|nr:cohesin domain-containing protein [Bryobacteraceae bacterium]